MKEKPIEKQITFAPHGHILTNANVWSPDGKWLVYDVRSDAEGAVFDGDCIEMVNAQSGEVRRLYQSQNGAHCGVASFDPQHWRIAFILGPKNPTPDWQYGAAHRQGVIVETARPNRAIHLDARDLTPPFTPGALRGGSHVHIWDARGDWLSFTYNDALLGAESVNGSDVDQRNLGVSVPIGPVRVAADNARNHDGAFFTVLATRSVNQPRRGSDEIGRAFEESWIGANGYLRADGTRQKHALAFQGEVTTEKGEKISEVFVADLPNDVTRPSLDGPLAGTLTKRPTPPLGTTQRRLTRTENRKFPGIAGPRHWLRSSPDGEQIAFLMRDDNGVAQIHTISPRGGAMRQITRDNWGVASAFTWDSEGKSLTYVADDSVFVVDSENGKSQRVTPRAMGENVPLALACVFSPDGKQIAYLKRVDGWNQIFVATFGGARIGNQTHLERGFLPSSLLQLPLRGGKLLMLTGKMRWSQSIFIDSLFCRPLNTTSIMKHHLTSALALSLLSLPLLANNCLAQPATAPIKVRTNDSVTLFDFRTSEKTGKLVLNAPPGAGASRTLRPTTKNWDIGDFTRLEFDVANVGTQKMQIRVRADNDGATDWGNSAIDTGFLAPGQRKIFNLLIPRQYNVRDQYPELKPFIGMSGLPGGLLSHWHALDARDVRALQIEIVGGQSKPQQLQVFSIRATHPIVPAILREKGAAFFPFVDRYGQYRWANWPGKVKSDAQLKANARAEARDLKAHPMPASWDRFGGWKTGPQLVANGNWGTVKRDGKWWIVDPDGHLFWSHGPNSVGIDSAGTRVTGRENFFEELPPRDLKGVWSGGDKPDAPRDANFLAWNMERQYGANWENFNRDLTHQRLHSWGMNTIGNWSSADIQEMDVTPFTASLWPWSPTFDGETNWDVYNPDFVVNFSNSIKDGVAKYANDPWCIGFFVHNEMAWPGNALGFMSNVMKADPNVYTKIEWIKTLRAKMPDIADFNRATGQNFADWDAVAANRKGFDLFGVKAESEAFYESYGDIYFKTCADALHKYAPGKLYLGSRMHVSNSISVRCAGKYCDVLSFNLYRSDISDFRADDVDKPVIASEFHFGSLDRGTFGTGLQSASDQNDRAEKYRFYVEGALKNPYIVGAHWFAYCPQAITGRADGENYEDGLFDNTNNPYPELRAAVRDVGTRMYQIRSGK